MKKIITLFSLLILFVTGTFAQTAHPFELGFNVGAAWLKSDVKMKKLGAGGGLTFGQTYCMNKTSPLLWGWRFRYLNANTYGQDTKKSYGIANNEVFNGSDSTLDYLHRSGFVYQNYKTHIDEVAVEMLLGANGIRERTNLYPYIFAGAGLTKAVARTNQLDGNDKMYNYGMLDSSGASGSTLSKLNNIYDGTYETLADGNLRPRWKFMPSAGVGIGYEVVKGFSIGLEHKITWAFNDVLDGQRWTSNNKPTGNNDMYHYSSFWIKFSFGRGSKGSSTSSGTNTNSNVNTSSNTNTNSGSNTTNVTNNNTGGSNTGGNISASTAAPVINITSPAASPFTTATPNMLISGTISGINSVSDMGIAINGNPVAGFTYNSSSHSFNYNGYFLSGTNTVLVTATNPNGSANAGAIIVYTQPQTSSGTEKAPVINFTFPGTSPYTTMESGISVTGSVYNISSRGQIQVMINGTITNDFTYNNSTHIFNIHSTLILGANTFSITAANGSGSDSKNTTVIFKQEAVVPNEQPAPVVAITSPSAEPYNSNVSPVAVTASILNITAIGQIQVMLNGGPVSSSRLIFHPASHQLSFNADLIQGANTILVSATNVAGSDSKTKTIIFTKPEIIAAPVITIISPNISPFASSVNPALINASVMNVTGSSQVTVSVNGNSGAPFSFDPGTHQLTCNANLINGSNTIVISASNGGGNASKIQIINYTPAPEIQPPVISYITPVSGTANVTLNTYAVAVKAMNILNTAQLHVTLNGSVIPGVSFQPVTKMVTFYTSLIEGNNIIVVRGTNAAGSDSKTITINYKKPSAVISTNPLHPDTLANPVNPVGTGNSGGRVPPSGGHGSTSVVPVNTQSQSGKDEGVQAGGGKGFPSPEIALITPGSGSATTGDAVYTLAVRVTNVPNAGGISVKINGTIFSATSYNSRTQMLSIPAPLNMGPNTIVIEAIGTGGTKTETVTITRQ